MPVKHLEVENILASDLFAAGAETSPSSTKHTGNDFLGHPGSANQISFTPLSTLINTGPARPCSTGSRVGCTTACASVPRNASSLATRTPVSCPPTTAVSLSKLGLAASATPFSPSELTFGTRPTIVFGSSAKSLGAFLLLASAWCASRTTPGPSLSFSLLPGKLRLLARTAARGVCKFTKEALSYAILGAT